MARTNIVDTQPRTTERLSVNVSTTTAQALREMATAKSTTVTEVIRRAVAVLKLLEDEQGGGTEIRLFRKDEGTFHVLHLV
jgi:predicted DNA-binding helix-hairpin-helix protein